MATSFLKPKFSLVYFEDCLPLCDVLLEAGRAVSVVTRLRVGRPGFDRRQR